MSEANQESAAKTEANDGEEAISMRQAVAKSIQKLALGAINLESDDILKDMVGKDIYTPKMHEAEMVAYAEFMAEEGHPKDPVGDLAGEMLKAASIAGLTKVDIVAAALSVTFSMIGCGLEDVKLAEQVDYSETPEVNISRLSGLLSALTVHMACKEACNQLSDILYESASIMPQVTMQMMLRRAAYSAQVAKVGGDEA